MSEAETYVDKVLRRAQLIKDMQPGDMTHSEETMAEVAAQVHSAPRLARALQTLLQSVHECVADSFDEGVRRELTNAARSVDEICRSGH